MTFTDRIIHTSHFLSFLIKLNLSILFSNILRFRCLYIYWKDAYIKTREREREREREFESLVIKDIHVSNLKFTGIFMELNETPVTDLYSNFLKLLLVSIFHFAGLFTHNLDVHVL